jgi:hypothetical protein
LVSQHRTQSPCLRNISNPTPELIPDKLGTL